MSDERENPVGNALRGVPAAHPFEQSLAQFAPAPPQLDRDQLMFLAGAASVQGSVQTRQSPQWLWPASTATLAATSLALAIALFLRPAPQTQYIVRDVPGPTQPAEGLPTVAAMPPVQDQPPRYATAPVRPQPATGDSYLKTREVALRMGLDALGSPSSGGSGLASAMTYMDLLEGLARGSSAGPAAGSTERFPNM
jgi:hypothetical protein